MAHQIGWSRRALTDLEGIAEYIAIDSPTYAANVVKKILNQVRLLA
jgi:plasmid stabilization system protein ParE